MEFRMSRTWVEIDLDIFRNNLKIIRNHIGKDVKMLAVIKADAYGHGAVPLAKVCEENEVDRFAVACVSEGIELRKAGIKTPILILSYIDEIDIDKIIEYDLMPSVYDVDFAVSLNKQLEILNKHLKVHIKLDTGMTRLGFDFLDVNKTVEDIVKINSLSNIEIEGVFTHYADSDSLNNEYCDLQFKRYKEVINALSLKEIDIPIKHTCNSAGAIAHSDKYLDMVRCGIMLYGYYPEEHLKEQLPGIKPFLSWKAKISQIREIESDTSVSYGRTKNVAKGTKLAVISVGYADGYQRRLSNNFHILVNGKKAPIVGRVCMDQVVVDISGIDLVKKGDTVTLLGTEFENSITADDFANTLDTISYEIICDIGKRVPRFYR